MPYPDPKLIAETADWIVVAKPAGWLTIPGRPEAKAEAPVLRQWVEKEAGAKLFVVHRIDRETSGLVLFAKNAEAHRRANAWFEKHEVRKAYDCLAAGRAASPLLKLRAPIDGAASLTQVEIRESFGELAFLATARPTSGRTHQIRIHLSGAGHPLLGDVKYGGPTRIGSANGTELAVTRTALHAARLELPSGEKFEAPWPEDFAGWVKALREQLT